MDAARGLDPRLRLAAAVAVLAFAVGLLVWSSALPGVFYDDGIYVMLGRAIASGHGLHYLGVPGAPPAAKYPPLFPLLLAGIWRLQPEAAAAFRAFELLNIGLAALGAGAFAFYLQRSLGYSGLFAGAVAFGAWLTADVWRYAVIPLSEPLFTLALVLALAAAARVERGARPAADTVLFLCAFAAAYYARTIGFVAALGLVLALLLAGRRRHALLVAGAALLLALPWALWARQAAADLPASLADLLGPYPGWLTDQLREHPRAFLAHTAAGTLPLARRLLATVAPRLPGPVQLAVAPLVLVAAVLGVREVWRRSPATVLAIGAFLGVLWLWPYGVRRLLAPAAPWLILFVAAGLWPAAHSRRTLPRRAALALSLAWGAWFVAASVLGLARREYEAPLLERSRELATAAAAVDRATPPTAVIGSAELWAGIHLLTGRQVAPSMRYRPVSDGAPIWGTPAEQLQLWRDTGIDYLWVWPDAPIEGAALTTLERACGPGSVTVVARSGVGLLLRLGWSPGCRERLAPTRP